MALQWLVGLTTGPSAEVAPGKAPRFYVNEIHLLIFNIGQRGRQLLGYSGPKATFHLSLCRALGSPGRELLSASGALRFRLLPWRIPLDGLAPEARGIWVPWSHRTITEFILDLPSAQGTTNPQSFWESLRVVVQELWPEYKFPVWHTSRSPELVSGNGGWWKLSLCPPSALLQLDDSS